MKWQPIETAPKNGTEIIGWRSDAGQILVRWSSWEEFLTDREIESSGLGDDALAEQCWFYADFVAGGRLEEDEAPTLWQPMPEPPTETTN